MKSSEYSGIGGLNEKTLHRQLKKLYLTEGSVYECPVKNYYADIKTPRGLIEIQTGSFSSLKKKLPNLLEDYPVKLVYPLAAEKFILTLEEDGKTIKSRRKSPKKQSLYHAAGQLLYIPEVLLHPDFELELLMTIEEEIRIDDGLGSWRRKGVSLSDRILIKIIQHSIFKEPGDYLSLLPKGLPGEFTNGDIFKAISGNRRTAGQISYLLKKLNLIECTGKIGNSQIFVLTKK